MRENLSSEKLRVLDYIKENAMTVVTIGGFLWLIYTTVIIPISQLQFQTNDVLNNHLKTIQDEQVRATTEREGQTKRLQEINDRLIRLETTLEQVLDNKLK
jgi:hypothetical protein